MAEALLKALRDGPWQAVILDFHGVLSAGSLLRRNYRRQVPRVLALPETEKSQWLAIEEAAYQAFQRHYFGLLRAKAPYTRALRAADWAYYGTILRAMRIPLDHGLPELATIMRRWEYEVNRAGSQVPRRMRMLLQKLAARRRLYLATSSSEAHIQGALEAAQLAHLFQGIFTVERIGFRKDDVRFWKAVRARVQEDAVVVDDTPEVLHAAQRAGFSGFLWKSG